MKGKLQILCYHGYEVIDEAGFRLKLFIRESKFRILPLGEALERMHAGRLPRNVVSITIDDGFFSTYKIASKVIKSHGIPVPVYVTSYYSSKKSPIFSLAVQYMFWKSGKEVSDLEGVSWGGFGPLKLRDADQCDTAMWRCIEFGETKCGEAERGPVLRDLGIRLGVDGDAIGESQMYSLMSPEVLTKLAGDGFDVQLNTHRHRLPTDDIDGFAEVLRKIRGHVKSIFYAKHPQEGNI